MYAPVKDVSEQFVTKQSLADGITKIDVPSHGHLSIQGRQRLGGTGVSLKLEGKNGIFSPSVQLHLTTDPSCAMGYDTQFSYPIKGGAILTDHWPAPTVFTPTVNIELRWSPTQLTAKVYGQEKTVDIRFTPKTLTLIAKGAPFIFTP